MEKPIARVLDLVAPESQQGIGMDPQEARRRVLAADPDGVLPVSPRSTRWTASDRAARSSSAQVRAPVSSSPVSRRV